jgi:hypothetical protein
MRYADASCRPVGGPQRPRHDALLNPAPTLALGTVYRTHFLNLDWESAAEAGSTRTYLINALGSPKSLKRRPFRQGQTIYEMASSFATRAINRCASNGAFTFTSLSKYTNTSRAADNVFPPGMIFSASAHPRSKYDLKSLEQPKATSAASILKSSIASSISTQSKSCGIP